MNQKYQNELLRVIADSAVDSMDLKTMYQECWDNAFGYASSLSSEELEQHCTDLGIDYLPYLNTGEDL